MLVNIHYRIKSILSIIIITLCFPLTLLYIFYNYLRYDSNEYERRNNDNGPYVLVSGGKMSKSLYICRCLWKSGYRVILLETNKYNISGSRFSRAVHHFEIVSCPRLNQKQYLQDLESIVRKYKCQYFIPVSSPISAILDSVSKEKLDKLNCQVVHLDVSTTQILDNKHTFCNYIKELGLLSLESYLITNENELFEYNKKLETKNGNYILKNIEYDPIHRLDLFKLPCLEIELQKYLKKLKLDGNPINETHPWQLQKFINGIEYTCFVIMKQGIIKAITISKSSSSQLNYSHLEMNDIEQWMIDFGKKTHITGQICVDFIKDINTSQIYPLECNPRIHSQCNVFLNHIEFGDALLNKNYQGLLKGGNLSVFWFYNEIFKLLPHLLFQYNDSNESFIEIIKTILFHKESDFDILDPLPFIMRNHFQFPILLCYNLIFDNPWKKYDFCIGKIVELSGD